MKSFKDNCMWAVVLYSYDNIKAWRECSRIFTQVRGGGLEIIETYGSNREIIWWLVMLILGNKGWNSSKIHIFFFFLGNGEYKPCLLYSSKGVESLKFGDCFTWTFPNKYMNDGSNDVTMTTSEDKRTTSPHSVQRAAQVITCLLLPE